MERCVVGIYIEMERCEKCVGVICENREVVCMWKDEPCVVKIGWRGVWKEGAVCSGVYVERCSPVV